jgi:DNA invertase Pin-like site-specific DNA recombinase
MGLAEAALDLEIWKRDGDDHAKRRDPLVRAAYESGITIKGISDLSGLSRTTVYKILGLSMFDDEDRATT